MTILPEAQTKLLIKLLGMLGSSFAGERSNAAEKANELIRGAGLTWESYILGGRSLREGPKEGYQATHGSHSGFKKTSSDFESGREPIAIVVIILHETQKAILVDPGDGPSVWLPKSQIIDQQSMSTGHGHIIGIPKWLAEAKGLTEWSNV